MLQRFLKWLFSPFPVTKSSSAYSIDELRDLRVRDLRKILYGFGISRDETKQLLDKEELLQTAFTLLEEERVESLTASYYAKVWRFTVIAMIIALFYISKEPLGAIGQQVQNHFLMLRYDLKVKADMVGVAMKTKLYLAMLSLCLTILLDIMYEWIQLSTFASWVVPYDAIYIRRLMFPFHINIPVSAGMLMGENMRSTDFGQQLGGYGMNVGPMLLMAALRYVKHQLQEYGAGSIHGTVFDKARRREEKKRRKMEEEELRQQDTPRDMDADSPPPRSQRPDPRGHMPSWPKKPPHMMRAAESGGGVHGNGDGGGSPADEGYFYSNDNDPGAEAAARERAEAEYRAAMAAKEVEFAKYLEMKAAEAKEAERQAAARVQEVEDMLTGPQPKGESQWGANPNAGEGDGGWAANSEDEEEPEE